MLSSGAMTSPTATDLEPACPQEAEPVPITDRRLVAVRRDFDTIPQATWDRLAARTPWATPFARWCVQRAWWDAYGGSAHDQTLVVLDADARNADEPVAVVPLMHRHEVEPTDAAERTALRAPGHEPATRVRSTAKAVFFGTSYHADYATLLASPDDLAPVAAAVVDHLADGPKHGDRHPDPWDVVDLRRLRCGDPAADALRDAFTERAPEAGWRVHCEREDVCPVLTLPDGVDFEGYLATLGKKERHEVRRKLRRAEAAGEISLVRSEDPQADLDAFVDLHQKRWGADGLFPPTPGGEASRRFFARLFELCGPDGTVQLHFLQVGGRRIAAGVHLDDGQSLYYYNAGVDPEAREFSPGVVMVAQYIRLAMELGRRRLDFLRGDEAYKYEWGAVDEPIQRLLVSRMGRHGRAAA